MNEITTTNSNGALMSFIERAAKDDSFDVAKFGELLRLQRDVGQDQSRRAFNAAMAEAQAEMLPVVRDAKNSHLGNRYARLETIDAAMRPIYTRHGFSVRFGSALPQTEGSIRLTCTVAHAGGYFEENYLDAPIGTAGSQGGRTATTPVQAVGSAVTYLRRYLLGMVFNIVLADDDDDGESVRRAAAAPIQRAANIAEKAPAYEAPATDPQPARKTWLQLADAMDIAERDIKTPEELGLFIAKAENVELVRLAREGAYHPTKARIIAAYERAETRYLADPPDPPEPEGDDLPEVEIAGADKVMSG